MKAHKVALAALVLVIVLLTYVLLSSRKPSFENMSAGIDQSKPSSSHKQTTNHVVMPQVDLGPIQGYETQFRVNQYNSYQV